MNVKEIVKELAAIVGEDHVTDEDFILAAYDQDFGTYPPSIPLVVVRPGSTEEVSVVMKFCNENKVPVSPRGGGSAQEGGCLAAEKGIVLETLRLDKIVEMDKTNNTVTAGSGITFASLMNALERNGQKIGVAPSGAIPGTIGGHLSRPGVGWGNIKYSSQGDQVLGVTAVLPNGDIIKTGTAANPNADCFYRYCLGPDLTGLFIGAEGAYGIVTEATLRTYAMPEVIYLERYVGTDLHDAVEIFQQIAFQELTCYVSCPVINPGFILFDINVEGTQEDVDMRVRRVREIVAKYPSFELKGSDAPMEFWRNRWYHTGEEFAKGIAGPVNYFLPYDKLEEATLIMRGIMDKYGIKTYSQQMFIGPSCSEHVSLMFYYPGDKEEYEKISKAVDEMMRKSLELGGAPYSKGRLWGPLLNEFLGETGYWNLANSIKAWLDPNNIMNPGVLGLKGSREWEAR